MINAALDQAKLRPESVDCLAVGIGPGSYTGIRAAIALAQGWQLARPVNLLGISSLDAMAHQLWREGTYGKMNLAVDAQRNEFYLAAYDISATGFKEIELLRLTSLEEIIAKLSTGEPVVGHGLPQGVTGARELFPDATDLAQLACTRADFQEDQEELAPIYLRETTFVKAPPPRIVL